MLKRIKAQASIEYIVIITFILAISIFFVLIIFKTNDINYSIHQTKQETLRLISESDSSIILEKINYEISDNTILHLNLNFLKIHPTDIFFIDQNYSFVKQNILNKTKFTDVVFSFKYI
ncbi:MAG: hypothetical protein PHR26_02660 [Candidatus ainarchaeum sp.]|nr:hypothetical protein [Candidatus ainarchaeum sp.]MDD3975885.1 hypothetical protein [Candidatus ainarchaeum sp.]